LKGHIKRPKVRHKAPLTEAQIPEIVQRVQQSRSLPETKMGLQLLLRLFVRPGELRKGEWAEFDFDRAEWRIPAAKMKKKEEFVVPLSRQAIDELQALRKRTGSGRWLLPHSQLPCY
jgi:integrase